MYNKNTTRKKFTSCPPLLMQCLSTISFCGGAILHILAVESPEPEANKSSLGFHAQMNTSESCPFKTMALSGGISMPSSTSMGKCPDPPVGPAPPAPDPASRKKYENI